MNVDNSTMNNGVATNRERNTVGAATVETTQTIVYQLDGSIYILVYTVVKSGGETGYLSVRVLIKPINVVSGNPPITGGGQTGTSEGSNQTPPMQSNYAGNQTPTPADFAWYTGDVLYNGLPAGRTTITKLDEIQGHWMAYEQSSLMPVSEGMFIKLFNTEITGSAGQMTLTYNMQNSQFDDAGTGIVPDLSLWNGINFSGSFSGGPIVLVENGGVGRVLTITEFYTLNGYQYAVGEVSDGNAAPVSFALVRRLAQG